MSISKKLKQLKQFTARPLNHSEKDEMKREFSLFLDEQPLPESAGQHLYTPPSIFMRFVNPYASVGCAVALMFTIGASEFSLPNDTLYTIKTNVNERVLLASTYFSPILHAEAGHTVFARRLEEAEQLMLLEQLTAHTADKVQTDIDQREAALNQSIERAEATGRRDEADRIRAELDVTLAHHDPLLDILDLRKEVADPAVIDALITEVVREHARNITSAAIPEAFESIKYEIMDEYAESLLDELETLNKAVAERISTSDDETIAITVSKELAMSNEARNQAEDELAAGNPEAALTHLSLAIEATQRALAEIDTASAEETNSPSAHE